MKPPPAIGEHGAVLLRDNVGVDVHPNRTLLEAFDLAAAHIGLPSTTYVPDKHKRWVINRFLRQSNTKRRLSFQDLLIRKLGIMQSRVLHRSDMTAQRAQRVEAQRLADAEAKLLRRQLVQSWSQPISNATSTPEGLIVISGLPAEKFYASREWRQLRYEALRIHRRRCQECGASPETGAFLQVHHIKPRLTFPEFALEISNLIVLCQDCHEGKHWTDLSEVA